MFYPLLQPNRRDRENVCLVAAGRVQGGHWLGPPPGQVSRALRGGHGEGVRRGDNGLSPPAAATLCCVVLCCDAVLKGRREGRLLKITGRGDWDGRAHGLATRGLLPYRISGDAADGLTSSLHTFEGRVPVIHHCPCTRPSGVGWPGAAAAGVWAAVGTGKGADQVQTVSRLSPFALWSRDADTARSVDCNGLRKLAKTVKLEMSTMITSGPVGNPQFTSEIVRHVPTHI